MNEDAVDEKEGNGLKLLQTGLKAHYEVLLPSLHCTSLFMFHFISIYNSQFSIYNLITNCIELVFDETIYKVTCQR